MQSTQEISYTDITEVYLEELRRGNRVNLQALAKQFPKYAKRILTELPLMNALERNLRQDEQQVPSVPNFQLIQEIGRGSSGIVYKAKHDSGRIVAIKFVHFDNEYSNLARLDREIETLKRLNHPNLVSIDSYGVIDDYVYIVTNLIEGISLAELLTTTKSLQGKYWKNELKSDRDLLATWGLEIASALEYVHQNKVIHRDIKPSNILIDRSGKCWLIDFGLAKVGEAGMTITQSRQIAGTPRFMAPEQLQGVVDNRCDIFGLGRTLLELANHDIAIDTNDSETKTTSLVNSAIPQELARIIEKACEPSSERRYQSAKELVAVLTRYLEGKRPCDRRRSGKRMTEQEFKASMRNRVRWSIAAGIVCFLSTFAYLAASRMLPKQEYNSASVIKPDSQNDSLKQLASAIESEESGFVDVIGEVLKHSVVNQSDNQASTEEVTNKIDKIVEKVKTEGLKPGELDSLMKNYRDSPLLSAGKIRALHHPLQKSTLRHEDKIRGHTTLELLSKATVNKHITSEKSDRMLAALFNGNVPRLEQIVSMQIPDEVLVHWLKLVESSFGMELRAVAEEKNNSNQELNNIINGFLHQANR